MTALPVKLISLVTQLISTLIQPPWGEVPFVTSETKSNIYPDNVSKKVASSSTRRSDENGRSHVYIVMVVKLAVVFRETCTLSPNMTH